jgi:tripartite-type tricarboxylate transporter receptor subunit TctC
MFKMMAGIDMVHVPYRASPLADLLSGQIQVMLGTIPGSIEHIKAGKLRALGVTTATRLESVPDIPTIGEYLPGYEASAAPGIGAPKNTPAEIIDTLNREINKALAETRTKLRLYDLGLTPLSLSSTGYGKLIADETEKWAKVIKFAGIKAE